jgi:hypothetical protein
VRVPTLELGQLEAQRRECDRVGEDDQAGVIDDQ